MTIHMTAKFEVKQEVLDLCQQVIQEFVDAVRVSEPDTLLYTSLQEKENPTHFLHYFNLS
jgi:quinol monooxygenase YgiN